MHKAVETPIIRHHAVTYFALALFFRGLVLMLFDDCLLLGEIVTDHGPFSQCVSHEMEGFVQTVLWLAMVFLGHPLVGIGEMKGSTRFSYACLV